MNTIRHNIEFGERVHWTPPTGAAEFYIWLKVDDESAAMRWRRIAGWDLTRNRPVTITDAPDGRGILLITGEINLDWATLLTAFNGYDAEVMQITTLDGDDRLFSRDLYSLPVPTTVDAATIAGQERGVLAKLLKMRSGLASMEAGHIRVRDPSGTEVERMEIAVIDRRIAEVRARIHWFELAADDDIMPRATLW